MIAIVEKNDCYYITTEGTIVWIEIKGVIASQCRVISAPHGNHKDDQVTVANRYLRTFDFSGVFDALQNYCG